MAPTNTPPATDGPSTTAATGSPGATRTPLPTRPPDLAPFSTLVDRSRSVSYEQLLAAPDRYTGDMLYFRGRVREVTDDGDGRFEATLNVGSGRELLVVYYAETYFGHPLVRGDSVRLVGRFLGLLPNAAGEPRPAVEVIELRVRFT